MVGFTGGEVVVNGFVLQSDASSAREVGVEEESTSWIEIVL
jgi:single-stranded DNA-binding protein